MKQHSYSALFKDTVRYMYSCMSHACHVTYPPLLSIQPSLDLGACNDTHTHHVRTYSYIVCGKCTYIYVRTYACTHTHTRRRHFAHSVTHVYYYVHITASVCTYCTYNQLLQPTNVWDQAAQAAQVCLGGQWPLYTPMYVQYVRTYVRMYTQCTV